MTNSSEFGYDDANSNVTIHIWSNFSFMNIARIAMTFNVKQVIPANWHICRLPVKAQYKQFIFCMNNGAILYIDKNNQYIKTVNELPIGDYVFDTSIIIL